MNEFCDIVFKSPSGGLGGWTLGPATGGLETVKIYITTNY